MLNPFDYFVSVLGRTWFKVALVAALFLAVGGSTANAQFVYYQNNTVSAISTQDDYVLVRATPYLVPYYSRLTFTYTTRSTGGSPVYYAHLYLYDATLGCYVNSLTQAATLQHNYWQFQFPVQPGHAYVLLMYVTNPQINPNRVFYNDCWFVTDEI